MLRQTGECFRPADVGGAGKEGFGRSEPRGAFDRFRKGRYPKPKFAEAPRQQPAHKSRTDDQGVL